jgi:hypothetical protein
MVGFGITDVELIGYITRESQINFSVLVAQQGEVSFSVSLHCDCCLYCLQTR